MNVPVEPSQLPRQVIRTLFYLDVRRFLLALCALSLLPLLVIKGCLLWAPSSLPQTLGIVSALTVAAVIIVSCAYMLSHYRTLTKKLEPVRRMAEVGEFAVRVAHDLRAPLSGIEQSLEGLQRHCEKETAKEWLSLLRLSSHRLNGVANDILAMHFPQQEQAQLLLWDSWGKPLVEFYSKRFPEVEIRVTIQSQGPVLGYKSQLERALMNLFSNALEAMRGRGELDVLVDRRQTSFHISIQDNGPGIPEGVLKEIHSGRPVSYGKVQGHGIGLTSVRTILKQHQGSLAVSSVEEGGACFEVCLPLAENFSY